jgi:methylated-DNA-[protein]-cysteine S-methyltransferase
MSAFRWQHRPANGRVAGMTQLLLSEALSSPVGAITILTDGDGVLRALEFEDHHDRMERLLRLHYPQGWRIEPAVGESAARRALTAYFAGDLSAIDTLPTATGGTAFQRAVWAALRDVPAGRTVAYADIAAAIDRPSAMRAVGMANGSNPIAIVVPCHRIIGRSGQLTGYAGGLARKQWLLAHEGVATGLLV